MGETTGIAWADHTFNPWWGCTRVSPGCQNCYAETMDVRFGGKHWGPRSQRRIFGGKHWHEPERWNREAQAASERRKVFCASMADVFEEHPDVVREREALWDLIERTLWLDWLLLTKRPENILKMLPWGGGASARFGPILSIPWRNVWIGTSVEDQQRADERIPVLLEVPALVRFLSVEPLLGPVDLMPRLRSYAIHWVIIGGESGQHARPCALEWIEDVIDQCRACSVPVFVKQLGSCVVSEARTAPVELMGGKPEEYKNWRAPSGEVWAWKMGTDDHKGADPSEWPAELNVRSFPATVR